VIVAWAEIAAALVSSTRGCHNHLFGGLRSSSDFLMIGWARFPRMMPPKRWMSEHFTAAIHVKINAVGLLSLVTGSC